MTSEYRVAANDVPPSLAIISQRDIDIMVTPTVQDLTILNLDTNVRDDIPLRGEPSIWLGDTLNPLKPTVDSPPVRILVPVDVAPRLDVMAMIDNARVNLFGHITTPLRLADFTTTTSELRARYVDLTGGDLQFAGYRREEAPQRACTVSMKDVIVSRAQTIQVHGDAQLKMSVLGGEPLTVYSKEDGAIPDISGPPNAQWTWHYGYDVQTVSMTSAPELGCEPF